MLESELIKRRIEFVLKTGAPLRPAYNELKSALMILTVIAVMTLISTTTIAVELLERAH